MACALHCLDSMGRDTQMVACVAAIDGEGGSDMSGVAVLVVDDDAPIRESVRFILEDEGYDVYEAPDGEPALERLRQHPTGMVVLLDVNMPGMDGMQVLWAVEAEEPLATRNIYILMTALDDVLPGPLLDHIQRHALPILSKPFDLDQLLDIVAEVAERLP